MEKVDKSVKAHLFVCCRKKENKPCCSEKGAENIVKTLKEWTKLEGLKDVIKVSQSSCLGHCSEGIAACLYPQNQWFKSLTEEDIPQLKEKLLAAHQSDSDC